MKRLHTSRGLSRDRASTSPSSQDITTRSTRSRDRFRDAPKTTITSARLQPPAETIVTPVVTKAQNDNSAQAPSVTEINETKLQEVPPTRGKDNPILVTSGAPGPTPNLTLFPPLGSNKCFLCWKVLKMTLPFYAPRLWFYRTEYPWQVILPSIDRRIILMKWKSNNPLYPSNLLRN